MSNKVSELVESYINGNISWVAGELQRARKVTVLQFAQELTNVTRYSEHPENGISVAARLVQMQVRHHRR